MITLYHAPFSRSTGVVALLRELDALDEVTIETVSIRRQDGSGIADPRNPHPEGKVPLLVHDGVEIWERSAIMLYLADLFSWNGLNIPAGDAKRGAYLSWFAWYAAVVEPVTVFEAAGLSHPMLERTFRSSAEIHRRLEKALADGPYLFGARYTAADLLLSGPYAYFGKPGVPIIDAWVDRCIRRPGCAYAAEFDAAQMADG